MTPARADLAVVGGGLVGLASAVEAAHAGLRVVLLEADHCGRWASSASAGGVRSLDRHPAEIPLARAALEVWRELPAIVGDDGGFEVTSQVRVAEDAAALAALETRAARVRDLGWSHERVVDAAAVRRRVPAMADHVQGALVVDDDGFADPLRCVHAYRRAAVTAGVDLREGVRVRAIEREGGGVRLATTAGEVQAGHVVNAAGAWGADLAAAVGEPVRARTAALQMTVLERVAAFVEPVIGSEGHKLSLKQGAEGTVIIGGAYEGRLDAATGRTALAPSKVAANLANAVRLFPHLRTARIVRTWAGVEGMTADALPVLGPSGAVPGLVHAFGFSGHGFALAPLVGRLVADLVGGRASDLPLAPFAVERFDAARVAAE